MGFYAATGVPLEGRPAGGGADRARAEQEPFVSAKNTVCSLLGRPGVWNSSRRIHMRKPVRKAAFSLWMPADILEGYKAEAKRQSEASGTRVSASRLIVEAATRVYRRRKYRGSS
jgi:hypothetical protein